MKYSIIISFFLGIVFSCNENDLKKSKPTLKVESIKPFETYFFGKPLILTRKDILNTFGEPDTIRCSVAIIPGQGSSNGEKIHIDSWEYYSSSIYCFDVIEDNGYLSYVHFLDKEISIESPNFKWNYKTDLDKIQIDFPLAFEARINEDSIVSSINLSDGFISDSTQLENSILLKFEDGRISKFYYTIFQTRIFDSLIK